MSDRITYTYERNLQAVYNDIGDRGICIDPVKLEATKIYIDQEINRNLKIASNQWGCHVFIGRENDLDKTDPNRADSVNINATQGDKALLKKLKDIYGELPKITVRNEEGEYESKYSAGELVLQKMLIMSVGKFPGGDPAIRAMLRIRELGKLKSSYISARLYHDPAGNMVFLSSYNVAGTLTGRRASKKHIFGYGNNGQNFPSHGELSHIFRRCLVARPGNVFLMVDQKSAEEWPVSALAQNYTAIAELQSGVNRHIKRASWLFGIPVASRTEKEWKADISYYLGKKTGHANNYGMKGQTMSDSLAKEGHALTKQQCDALLAKENAREPSIQGVFHKYVEAELSKTRILRTPFGRERQFFGLRNNDYNGKIFREAYSYIPQSTVGDNNGFAVLYLESTLPTREKSIVQEGHDSIVQDVPARASEIWKYLNLTIQAYDRRIKFHNGIELQIPIEAELAYNWAQKVKIAEPFSFDTVVAALKKLNALRQQEKDEEEKNRKDAEIAAFMAAI